jgi:hypothetical protein
LSAIVLRGRIDRNFSDSQRTVPFSDSNRSYVGRRRDGSR